jgi:hypothetical protein
MLISCFATLIATLYMANIKVFFLTLITIKHYVYQTV